MKKNHISTQTRDYNNTKELVPVAQPSLHSPFLLFVHPLARYARVSLSPLIPPPYRRIGRSPARRATSDGERRDVRWGGGKGQ